jgi:PAS domain-containing protein
MKVIEKKKGELNVERNLFPISKEKTIKQNLTNSQLMPFDKAFFVLFDRRFEYINDKFSELFSISPEEACSYKFNPMRLISQECQSYVYKKYNEIFRGCIKTENFQFTGISMDGNRIECNAFILNIPYKWGTALNGILEPVQSIFEKQVFFTRK